MKYYDEGWNDFIDGKILPELKSECTRDYRDGWLDARLCSVKSSEKLKPQD